MSSLHTKYRPSTLSQLIGQGFIKKALSGALERQMIAPAYLFVGSRGTGKTSTARILAKSLNCQTGVTLDPCGQCVSCRTIDHGSSLDVIEIDAASNSGVDDARELTQGANISAVSRYRVFIIDECHMLSTSAQNALLKTLEEPPKHVVFILATTDPQKVLPTIRSRCHEFRFNNVTHTELQGLLRNIADKENISIDSEAIKVISNSVNGGVRDAQTLLATLSTLETVTVKDVYESLGSQNPIQTLEVIKHVERHDTKSAINALRVSIDSGIDPKAYLEGLISLYRDLLYFTSTGSLDLVKAHSAVKLDSVQTSPNACLAKLERLSKASSDFNKVSQSQLNTWLEVLVIELSLMESQGIQPSLELISTPVSAPIKETLVKTSQEPSIDLNQVPSSVSLNKVNETRSNDLTNGSEGLSNNSDDCTESVLGAMSRLTRNRFETCQFKPNGVVLFSDEASANLAQSSAMKVLEAYTKAGYAVTEISYQVI
jgi:DNA polymerase-3 subunit gamma/tau